MFSSWQCWKGSCHNLDVYKRQVEIKDHKYQDIKLLEHKNGRGKPAEIIPSKVVEAQSLNVDTVSGATMSSKVILQAIQNALN